MISVVAPTWAAAERQATAAVKRVSATRRAVTTGLLSRCLPLPLEELRHVGGGGRHPREPGQAKRFRRQAQRALVVIARRGLVPPLRLGAHSHPHNPSPTAGRIVLAFIEDDDQQTIPLKVRARNQGRDVLLE